MRVVTEMSARVFKPWGKAVEFLCRVNPYEMELLDDYLNEITYHEPIDETDVNNMFCFEDEFLITAIFKEDYDDFYSRPPRR